MQRLQRRGLEIIDIERRDFPLPGLGPALDAIRLELLTGRGFVLIRGLGMEERSAADAATIFWGIGRYLGRVVVARIVGEERLESFELRVNRNTRFIHIVLFQTMLPSEIPGYVLGSIRYRFIPFAIALGLVELPFAVGTIYIGDSFLQQRGWLLVAVAAGGALLVAVAYAIYRHRQISARLSAAVSAHDAPEEGMVGVPTAMVANCSANRLRDVSEAS